MNAQELMVKALRDSGYSQLTGIVDEDDLAHKEFFLWYRDGLVILCLGSGHSGHEGCK